MRGPNSHLSRPTIEWGTRLAIAMIIAAIAWLAINWTLAQTIASRDPARAHRIAPGDGRISARLAASLIEADPTKVDRRKVWQLAVQALHQDATAVLAAASLGLLDDNAARSRRRFEYAQALSRRNLATQLWGIEDSVRQGDVRGALHHYDIALRTEPAAADLLFPILATATADPAIRSPLVHLLAKRPMWGGNFITHMSASGPDPKVTAVLFAELRRAGVTVSDEASARAVDRLLDRNLPAHAWSYYASIRLGATRTASRDPKFTASLATPSRFDWSVVEADGITASIQRGPSGGIFDFSIATGVGGPLLRQDQLLPPKEYRIEGHSSGFDQSTDGLPYWTLICRDIGRPEGRELGRVTLPSSAGYFAGRFDVPADCPVQTLVLMARPVSSATGLSGQIDRVTLMAARMPPHTAMQGRAR